MDKKNTDKTSIIAQGFVLSEFLTDFVSQLSANPNQSLSHFYSSFESKLGIQPIAGKNVIFTPGSLLGLLYLMIVFPQQKFELKNPKLDFKNNEWGNPEIKLWNKYENQKLDVLIRRLRNSISHGRIQFDEKMNMIFEDVPMEDNPSKGKKKNVADFRILLSLESLKTFTNRLVHEFKL